MIVVPQIRLIRIFISPAHNFVGHHGGPAGENPAAEVDEIRCVTGRGIEGDRYFDHKKDYKGQITFFEWEVYARLCRDLGVVGTEPSVFRRNVITRGIDLNTLIGKNFEIQGVQFEGVEECRPCNWMDVAVAPGAEKYMKGHGGLRARILTDGVLRVDAVDKP